MINRIHSGGSSHTRPQWDQSQYALNTKTSLSQALTVFLVQWGSEPSYLRSSIAWGVVWIVRCQVCLSWGHMVAWGIYRVGSTTVFIHTKSSPLSERGVKELLLNPFQTIGYINYGLTMYPSNLKHNSYRPWRCRNMLAMSVVLSPDIASSLWILTHQRVL